MDFEMDMEWSTKIPDPYMDYGFFIDFNLQGVKKLMPSNTNSTISL